MLEDFIQEAIRSAARLQQATKRQSEPQLDELIETSECDGILTEGGIILTRAGESRLRAQSDSQHREDTDQQEGHTAC